MLIQIHMIQNHAPSNLNRDDLGAPKTCYFGGVIRSRISSQCLKRSIRMSPQFGKLLGGIRTRRLAYLIAEKLGGSQTARQRAEEILNKCGLKSREGNDPESGAESKMLVYTTHDAVEKMAELLGEDNGRSDDELAEEFARIITHNTAVPDIALFGRMLEPESTAVWKKLNTTVEAALQCSHAISTHEARPEVDYYVAADDIPGTDAGAGYVDEALFASACFYKYFSIDWQQLLKNLEGFSDIKADDVEALAAHTVGAFLRGAALVTPTGKQNSFAAHNPPDGILVELRDYPISYANAFAKPVDKTDGRDIVAQSIVQMAQYIRDLDVGYGIPQERLWFSPNLRFRLQVNEEEIVDEDHSFNSFGEFIPAVIRAIDDTLDWEQVQNVVINRG